jgi:hypothetical protein
MSNPPCENRAMNDNLMTVGGGASRTVGRAVPLVAPKRREGGCAPRLPTNSTKHSPGVAGNHSAVPRLRILFAACRSTEFAPANHCATLAARSERRAPPTHRIPNESH